MTIEHENGTWHVSFHRWYRAEKTAQGWSVICYYGNPDIPDPLPAFTGHEIFQDKQRADEFAERQARLLDDRLGTEHLSS